MLFISSLLMFNV